MSGNAARRRRLGIDVLYPRELLQQVGSGAPGSA
jgi:hypothetical protein